MDNERKILDTVLADVREDPERAAEIVQAEMTGRGCLAVGLIGEVATTALEVLLEQHHRLQGLMD